MIDVLLAVPDLQGEPDLVAGAAAVGLRVVRRCVDAVDLLASASVASDAHVVLSPGLPRLTGDAVERLRSTHVVVGLAGNPEAAGHLRDLGVPAVLIASRDPAATMRTLARACESSQQESGVVPAAPAAGDSPAPRGRLIAVWGPMGAPGRTTVAIGLSEHFAGMGLRTCLVDADTYAPSIAMALGVVDDVSGLLVACRSADHAALSADRLAALAAPVDDAWHVLGGLPRVDRWPELRAGALSRVWAACRAGYDVTVVDVGFCVEDPGEQGAWALRRNAATLTALAEADRVVAVADASSLGAARLASSWQEVTRAAPDADITVVRNRSRGGGRQWRRALAECGVGAAVLEVPRDQRALEGCWARGRSLREGARRSKARRALGDVTTHLMSG